MQLKTRIGELMKDRGWAPLDLKDRAGVAQATAYKLSRDDVNRIDLETLGKLCAAFNTTVDRIIVVDNGR